MSPTGPPGRAVALGGTFDRLHAGHMALLSAAFRAPGLVAIGLTTDAYLGKHPKTRGPAIERYRVRRRRLAAWLTKTFPHRPWIIRPLDDRFGGSVEAGVRTLIASVETREGARAVNRERRRRGLPPLRVVLIPLVLADDLAPLTSTRIRQRLIDRMGHRTSPIRVGIVSTDLAVLADASRGVRGAFPRARVAVKRGRPRPGATAREVAQEFSRRALRGNELGIGLAYDGKGGRRWVMSERSASTALFPRPLPRGAPGIRYGLERLLRPSGRPDFFGGRPAKGYGR